MTGRPREREVPRPRRRVGARRALLLALVVAASGCGMIRDALAPAPVGKPAGRPGWLVYGLRDLSFEAPAAWGARGGERRIALEAPDGRARLEITYPEREYPDEKACLAAAEEKLRAQAQDGGLERARRYATRFAGRPAQTLEADQGGWHVWAYAACDGGVQYRVFFTAATPSSPEVLEAWRALRDSARVGGEA